MDFFLGRIFQNLGGNRNSRYPSRNDDTGQKKSVTFEFEVEKESKYMRLLLMISFFGWRSGKPSRLSTEVTVLTPATVSLFVFVQFFCSKKFEFFLPQCRQQDSNPGPVRAAINASPVHLCATMPL
jgi:hypothetical protein